MTRRGNEGLRLPEPALEEAVQRRLDEVESGLEKAVRSDAAFVTETAGHLLAAGGKRFRPMLVILSSHLGDPSDARLVPLAVAVELTHLATLYHDDVIDEADHRRGIDSVNARWGNTVAILAGDYLFARAADLAADLGTEVSKILARTIATLCEGQIQEVRAAGRLDESAQEYMAIIRNKTAALLAASCRLGGTLSDADPEVVERLDRYGEALGLAFQLSDDIMDVIATEADLGKEPGVDMKEGVYTLPVLYALHEGSRLEELRQLLAEGPPSGQRLARALEIVRSDATLRFARRAVTREAGRATAVAKELPAGAARDALVHLATFLAVRCGADAP